jgi:hypothetical protein
MNDNKLADKLSDFSPVDAERYALDRGFTAIKEISGHKKHYKANATKDGGEYKIHIHRDGHIDIKGSVTSGSD